MLSLLFYQQMNYGKAANSDSEQEENQAKKGRSRKKKSESDSDEESGAEGKETKRKRGRPRTIKREDVDGFNDAEIRRLGQNDHLISSSSSLLLIFNCPTNVILHKFI